MGHDYSRRIKAKRINIKIKTFNMKNKYLNSKAIPICLFSYFPINTLFLQNIEFLVRYSKLRGVQICEMLLKSWKPIFAPNKATTPTETFISIMKN